MTDYNSNQYGSNSSSSGNPQPPSGYGPPQSSERYENVSGAGNAGITGGAGYSGGAEAAGYSGTPGYAARYGSYAASNGSGAGSGAGNGTGNAGKKSSGVKTFFTAFGGAALACVLAFGGLTVYQSATGSSGSTVIGGSGSSITAADEDATLAEAVADKCLPSVVAIDVYTQTSSNMYGMYGYGSSSNSGELTESSLGSGVVITEDGYILTNYHVIEGADALKVTIEGQEYDAEIIGTDSSSDLAVIKAQNASGLTAIELGDSDSLNVGEWVMSIGSPFGLEQSVATGIVSATNRSRIASSSTNAYGQSEVTYYTNMIQTDAAINPGNSGGALVDSDGKLIGINTLITSYSGNYSGVGFAIPVNYAVNIAQQIIDGKTPSHAQLGVSMSSVTSQLADRYGFAVDEGAYVSAVVEGSGAAAAGIQEGDIITAIDGTAVTSATDLSLAIRSHNAGDVVTVELNRDGQNVSLEVTLGSDAEESTSGDTQQQSATLLEQLFGGGSYLQNGDAA